MGPYAQLVLFILVVLAFLLFRAMVLKPHEFIDFYVSEGFTTLKGAKRPVVGNLLDFVEYGNLAKATDQVMENPFNWLLKQTISEDEKTYDSSKHRGAIMTVFNRPIIIITDPLIVEDLFTTKNKLVDKNGTFAQAFEDVAPTSFLFEPAAENWLAKKKAVGHAFYKDRLIKLVNVLKEKLNNWVDERNKEIEASSDG